MKEPELIKKEAQRMFLEIKIKAVRRIYINACKMGKGRQG